MRYATPLLALLFLFPMPTLAAEPDYRAWQELLSKHYNPAKGMNYKALKAKDKATLDRLRQQMAAVDPGSLSRPEQLAYWINLYNINVVGIDRREVPRRVDPRHFDRPDRPPQRLQEALRPVRAARCSLNDVENEKIRDGFKDPRIHFAINCAAKSCPPIRTEPYVGARVDQQLDDQARKFLNGPLGVRCEQDGKELTLHVTKIMDWFRDDFEKLGRRTSPFLRKYLPADKQKQLDAAKGEVDLEFDDYSWKLNDASEVSG